MGDGKMPRHQRIRSKSGCYHIIIRGNERKNIFYDDEDRQKFIEIINNKKQGKLFYLYAFCLMNNHVHMMLGEGVEDVARVMKRITVSYVCYFNKKYKRIGHLFQGRFKSEGVEDERYALSLVRYIHQNPLKAKMVKALKDYKWSSYSSYLDEENYFNPILDRDIILGMFSNDMATAKKEYERYMNEETNDSFLDLQEDKEIIDKERARVILADMLLKRGIRLGTGKKVIVPDEVIREFREKTNLSIRKIAAITEVNKDKINKIINRQ